MALTEMRWIQVGESWTRFSITRMCENDEPRPRSQLVIIPGNPGNQLFYRHFAEQLVEKFASKKKKNVEVVTVSHMNHVKAPKWLTGRDETRKDCSGVYKLADQIQHKADFIRQQLNRDQPIMLLGHSIGALICLRIARILREEGWNVERCCLLFPAVEEMDLTPSGRLINPLVTFFDKHNILTRVIAKTLGLIPNFVKRWIVQMNVGMRAPSCVVQAVLELFNNSVLSNLAHMARDELDTVHAFDDELLEMGDTIVTYYYGLGDGWVPLEFAERMRRRIEKQLEEGKNLNNIVLIDERDCEHAFVLRQSEIVADVIVEQFRE